ncbi:DUF2254 domain-containing protein [Roseibacillus persicicus]|uniref:DUF2254 domain-containing protein n=1 Tax=Roseibacillus persicicus TaxID=454148 RepID=A0A918TBS9_9BACT|nr:DUF2254 domain-containing protein [Roseibacillus persicicus]MDQ8192378.1 DUF2254 domain-containing protein [Roseibacillus persicicus]GHC41486.1 hypothetical protein GCM10007100_02830 [Roseibacillus persicicus]
MKQDARQVVYNLWSGLWFIPGLLTFIGLFVGLFFAGMLGHQPLPRGSRIVFEPSLAVSVLTSLAGALITVVGVVFSITMVVLSSASSQLGPRLLTNFLNKTGTKVAIGAFVGAFSYQLIVASALSMGKEVPDLTVWIGLGGGLASFGILLGFLHMVARFIQVPFVVDEVTRNLSKALGGFLEFGAKSPPSSNSSSREENRPEVRVTSEEEGFVQRIEIRGLVPQAAKHEAEVDLLRRAGQFVAAGDVLAVVRGGTDREELGEKIRNAYSLGPERTAQQDVEYALRQLVEIATKALSPGINDPETAINVIARVGGALARVSNVSLPSGKWYDDEECLRVKLPVTDVEGLLGTAYHPLRQFGAEIPTVSIALMESFVRLAERELHPEFAKVLKQHVTWLDEAVSKEDWLESDRQNLRDRRDLAFVRLEESLAS